MEATKIANLKMSELKRKFLHLLPFNRRKRGIINGIGTLIKTITGNMDAYDAEEINRQIRALQETNADYNNTINNQAIFNHKFTERIENITDHINKEQGKIGYFANKNANKIKNIEDVLQEQQYVNHIIYNIDILDRHLDEIAETILMAKLNIISKFILSQTELNTIHNIINNQSLNIISQEHMYETLKLQAYYNASNIIFNIQIPILSPENYKIYHIIPLLINNSLEINVSPYLVYNEQKIQYLTELCPNVENTFLCEATVYQEETAKSQCIGRLFNNKQATCQMNDVGPKQYTKLLENNTILLSNSPKILVTSTCRNTTFEAQGTLLIKFQNCSVNINDVWYDGDTSEFWDHTYMLPMMTPTFNSSSTNEVLSLQKLQHMSIKISDTLIQTRTQHLNNQIITYSTLIVLTIVTTLAIIMLKRRKNIVNYLIRDDNIASPTSKSLWPSLYLKGGGVMT